MFDINDFDLFNEPTLKGRLQLIYDQLDPKFEQLGQAIIPKIKQQNAVTFNLHIAKHLRRHKNPPMNTWMAFSESSRGYKMLPHLEIGFWDDRIFIWFALMAEMPDKLAYTNKIKQLEPLILKDYSNFDLSYDHMAKQKYPVNAANLKLIEDKFNTTKKGEFLLGKVFLKSDEIFNDPQKLNTEIEQVLLSLSHFYKLIVE